MNKFHKLVEIGDPTEGGPRFKRLIVNGILIQYLLSEHT